MRGLVPSGAAVIRYEGKRGVVWRIKYADADGRQVMETVGAERGGWTAEKAGRERGGRPAAVERGLRKPRRRTFGELLDAFEEVTLAAKPRKRTTLIDYRAMIRNHLRPAFAGEDLVRLSERPEAFERYAAEKVAGGLS